MKQTFIAWPAQHSFRLKCKAKGHPPLKYQWFKDGVSSFRRRLQPSIRTNMWSMKLKDLVPDDSGKYTCVVSNKYGSINHTYTLRVVGKCDALSCWTRNTFCLKICTEGPSKERSRTGTETRSRSCTLGLKLPLFLRPLVGFGDV